MGVQPIKQEYINSSENRAEGNRCWGHLETEQWAVQRCEALFLGSADLNPEALILG